MIDKEERDLEGIAMNIVFQIGDLLYENLPKDIAHDNFVDARQATNDRAIDFAKKLIKERESKLVREAKINFEHEQIGTYLTKVIGKTGDVRKAYLELVEASEKRINQLLKEQPHEME